MKSLLVTLALTASAVASAIQLPQNLMDRAIDPATMNPTLFSVLSVLKTGMPVGPNIPLPTGDSQPDWYQKLPGDVKSLLPELYPVAVITVGETSEVQASQVSTVLAPSEGEANTASAVVSASRPASSSTLSSSATAASSLSSASSANASDVSSAPSSAQSTPTKTSQSQSQLASTATADTVSSSSPSSSSISPPNNASPTPSSIALTSASATSSSSLSTGARFAAKTQTLAVIALSSVGAAFCILA